MSGPLDRWHAGSYPATSLADLAQALTGRLRRLDQVLNGSVAYTDTPLSLTAPVTIAGSPLTGSSAGNLVALSQTWNTTGAPTAVFVNITNTASSGASKLLDLQVNSTSLFSIDTSGIIRAQILHLTPGPTLLGLVIQPSPSSTCISLQQVAGTIADAIDVFSGSLTGSTSANILNLAQTWNTTGSPAAILLNITNTASAAGARLLDLQVGAASKFAVDVAGKGYVAGTQIFSTRRTGWTAWTGTATRTSVATSSATTAQCAQAIKALIDDLIAHGLIGT